MTIGDVLRSFTSPGGSGRGLTWDGHTLWHCDPATNLIYQLDPFTGAILRSFASPGTNPNGLAWDGHTLWNSDTATDLIYQLALN